MGAPENEINEAQGGGRLGLTVEVERWPIRGGFTISRGSKHEAMVVVATVSDGRYRGRGECVPYARYGETVEDVATAVEACASAIASGANRADLGTFLPAGAARNGDEARLVAVRDAVPHARLIADANEAWQPHEVESLLAVAAAVGVELVEQPLPADNDEILAHVERLVPVCADESVHDRASLDLLVGRFDAVNIKLDKTGGLTEALVVAARARALGLKVMVGSMVATSLAMAPALLLAQDADFVDLDGPLLLARDRVPGLAYDDGIIAPPPSELWG